MQYSQHRPESSTKTSDSQRRSRRNLRNDLTQQVIRKLRQRLFGEAQPFDSDWSWQVLYPGAEDVAYPKAEGKYLGYDDFLNHFSQKPRDIGGVIYGSMGIRPMPKGPREITPSVSYFHVIDIDDKAAADIFWRRVLPILRENGIPFLWEVAGSRGDRAHVWMVGAHSPHAWLSFIRALYRAAKLKKRFDKRGIPWKVIENYGSEKPNNQIRLFGGYHLRAEKAWGFLKEVADADAPSRQSHCHTISRPVDMVEAFLALPAVKTEHIQNLLKKFPSEAQELRIHGESLGKTVLAHRDNSAYEGMSQEDRPNPYERGAYSYIPRSLSVPIPDMPPAIVTMQEECAYFNEKFQWVKDGGLSEDGNKHDDGLRIFGLLEFAARRFNRGVDAPVYRKAAAKLLGRFYAGHGEGGHNWPGAVGDFRRYPDDKTDYLVLRCDKASQESEACQKCPLLNSSLRNPRRIMFGRKLVANARKTRKRKWTTNEHFREEVFPEEQAKISRQVLAAVRRGDFTSSERLYYLNAAPTGTGKSFASNDLIADIVKRSKKAKIVVLVPRTDLAIERQQELAARGINSHILIGYDKIWSDLEPGFDCPDHEKITRKLGSLAGRGSIKSQHCKKCPFEKQCPYPGQYTAISEGMSGFQVVIAQHAHLKTMEARRILEDAGFHLVIVDETVLDSLKEYFKVTEEEEALFRHLSKKEKGSGIFRTIRQWLKGEDPHTVLKPTEDDISIYKRASVYRKIQNRLIDIIRTYNCGDKYDRVIGIFKFRPLIKAPVTYLLDATPPIAMLKSYLNTDNIEEFGRGMLINPLHYHPKSKIVKVLGTPMTRSFHANPARSEELYVRILDYLQLTDKDWKSALIVAYKSDHDAIRKIIEEQYAEIGEKVQIGGLAAGTNKYADVDRLFLTAGVFINGEIAGFADFENARVKNFWNRQDDRDEEPEMFPVKAQRSDSIVSKEVPVVLNLIDPLTQEVTRRTFEDVVHSIPYFDNHYLTYEFLVNKSTQALGRARITPGKQLEIYDISNVWRPEIAYTHVSTFDAMFTY